MARKPKLTPVVGDAAVYKADFKDIDQRVRVVLTCNHIYLPLDDDGNVPDNYAELNGYPTSKVVRRTRFLVPADMAAALSRADKAEVL